MSKVAIYVRVSTDEQAERETIQNQLIALREYVKRNKDELVDEYIDDGVSSSIPLEKRRDGKRLLADAQAKRFDKVLIYRSDRIERDTISTLTLAKKLNEQGISLKSATENFDTTTSDGFFQLSILASVAEREKKVILERATLGRERQAKNGKWLGGSIPLGYDIDNGKLVLTGRHVGELGISEIELVKMLFNRVLEGQSTYTITKWLNQLGIKSYKRYSADKTSEHTIWRSGRLHKLLTNTVYTGKAHVRSKQGLVEYQVAAIIDADIFDKVSIQLQQFNRFNRKQKRVYLLSGMIRCGVCDWKYSAQGNSNRQGRVYYQYRCSNRDGCKNKAIKALSTEEAVWRFCTHILLHSPEYIAQARDGLGTLLDNPTSVEAQLISYRKQLGELSRQLKNVGIAFEKGIYSAERTLERTNELTDEIASIKSTISKLDNQVELRKNVEGKLGHLESYLKTYVEVIDDIEVSSEKQQKVIRELVKSVVVGIEDYEVIFKIGHHEFTKTGYELEYGQETYSLPSLYGRRGCRAR